MSKRSSLTTLLAGAWVLTLVAGFVAGRRSAPAPEADPNTAAIAGPQRAGRTGRDGGPSAVTRESRAGDHSQPAASASARRLGDVLSEVDRNARARQFLDYLARLSDDEFAGVAAELSTGPMAELHRSEYAMLLAEWAARDPYGAAEYMQAYARSDWERETLLAAWAARDPQAAFDWAANAQDEGEVNNWVTGAMRGIAASDPQLARQLLEAMDAGRTRDSAVASVATAIAALGPDGAGEWLEAIGDDDLRRRAARSIAGPLSRGEPSAAGVWVANISDVPARRDASEVVSENWARTDLESARQWVESLPEDTRTEAAEGVARELGRVDPQRGAEWLVALGDNPDLDGARHRFLDSASRRAPEVAAGVVATLSDERARTGYYHRIVGHWASHDAEAARAWVDANAATLPESLVRRIRQ